MLVHNIKTVEEKDYCRLCAEVEFTSLEKAENFELWYRFPKEYQQFISEEANPFLAALLVPCMKLGETLIIKGKVSKKLLDSTNTIMDIYHSWNKDFSKIKIKADGLSSNSLRPSANSLFFSGGVDSFYSLLKNIQNYPNGTESITHLIFVHGFDIKIDNEHLFNRVFSHINGIGQRLGKSIIPVKTNLRVHTDKLIMWGNYFGSALASIGLALNRLFKKVFIASGDSYAELFPYGSHPILDPLWSCESTYFVHDGCEATRGTKILSSISQSPIALESLRVCWQNPNQNYNCGICEKCLRTMITLHIAGALQKCKTFDKSISLKAIRNLKLNDTNFKRYFENLELLNNTGSEMALRLAIITCLRRNGYFKRFANFKKIVKELDTKILNGFLNKVYRYIR